MEKNMKTTIMGYLDSGFRIRMETQMETTTMCHIGTTIRIHSLLL